MMSVVPLLRRRFFVGGAFTAELSKVLSPAGCVSIGTGDWDLCA